MHKINVLAFGSKNFNTSLEELKEYLNFKFITINDDLKKDSFDNYDVLLIHENYFKKNNNAMKSFEQIHRIKILASNSNNYDSIIFSDKLQLPTSVDDINQTIANSIKKKSFSQNSSIKIKNYILDKNEKKLIKDNIFILLTEKEINLLELFSKSNEAIDKKKILDEIWKYASDADTHTVETHIYRLRKKIKLKFQDENFILNNENGYLI